MLLFFVQIFNLNKGDNDGRIYEASLMIANFRLVVKNWYA